jgi:branched-chain amino acid transport system substrate-binding protein
MKVFKSLPLLAASMVIVSTVTFGISSVTQASASNSKGVYEIGSSLALSGPLASYGDEARNLYLAYVNEINAAGGVNGHKIAMSFLDDAASPTTAAANMLQFTQRKDIAVVGGYISNQCTASAPIAARTRTPILCNSVDPSDVSPVHHFVFEAGNVEEREVAPMYQFTKTLLGSKSLKIAIVGTDDEGGNAWVAAMTAEASVLGYTVVASQVLPLTATSISTQASVIAAAKPDVTYMSIVGAFIQPLDQTLRAAGVTTPLIGEADTGLSPSIFQSVNDANLYTMYPMAGLLNRSDTGQLGKWAKQMEKLGAKTTDQMNAGLGTQTGIMAVALVAGLKACGWPCSGSQLANALQKINISIPGLVLNFSYSSTNHYGVSSYYVLGWNKSKQKISVVASGLKVGTA